MYDPVGRLAETYVANATIPGVRAEQVTYAYGPAGEVSATAADGGTTRYFFDNRGEIAEGEDPLGNFTHYVYDSNYNLTEVIDPAGQATRYAYDPNGHLMQTTDPDGHTVQYTHSGPFNALSSYTDPDGNTTDVSIQQSGRPALDRLPERESAAIQLRSAGEPHRDHQRPGTGHPRGPQQRGPADGGGLRGRDEDHLFLQRRRRHADRHERERDDHVPVRSDHR